MWAVWTLITFSTISGALNIWRGLAGDGPTQKYDATNVLAGCIVLVIVGFAVRAMYLR